MNLDKKIVVITGAASGMGRETSKLFALKGYKVVCTDFNRKNLDETISLIKNEGKEACSIVADLTKLGDIKNLAGEVKKKFNTIDILINFAGALGRSGNLLEVSDKDMDFIIDLNLKGTYRCCKYLLPLMLKNKSGLIINISSKAAKTPMPNAPIYTAAKWGVLGFTKSLNLALRDYGVKVAAINCASTNTNFCRQPGMNFSEELLNKFLDPIDIAKACLFIAEQSVKCIVPEIDLVPMAEVEKIEIK